MIDVRKLIIEEALKRLQERKGVLTVLSGGLLSQSEAANVLGITLQELGDRASLIVLQVDGNRLYPAFQFEDQVMVHGVSRIVDAIQIADPWTRLNFCFLKLDELDGRTPVEAIRAGAIDAVVIAARRFGASGASLHVGTIH